MGVPPGDFCAPTWVSRGVEVSAQARLCAALELEYHNSGELKDQPGLPLPLKEIDRLYSEAASVVRLLDYEHPVRHAVGRALLEREMRLGRLGALKGLTDALLKNLPKAVACILVGLPLPGPCIEAP